MGPQNASSTVSDQRRARSQQLAGERVPQPVRADVRDARAQAGALDDIANEIGADRTRRRLDRQEHVPGVALAAQRQILGQRLPNIRRQRQPGRGGVPLRRITTSPARQSRSSGSVRATSIKRTPAAPAAT